MNAKDDRPPVGEGAHPIATTRYRLPTPMIEEACAAVIHLVQMRYPGGVVFAPSRYGKSTFIGVLRVQIEEVLSGTDVIVMDAWSYPAPRERAFFSDLLFAAGHVLPRSGTADQMRHRLITFLVAGALKHGNGRVVLVIDEAQNLEAQHYRWLIGIHNQLSLQDVNLTVLLVGQHELLEQRSAFVNQDKQQIVGRFMVHLHRFRGVRSLKELEEVLRSYDERMEYPVGSGWSFSRYYAWKSFGTGWRLSGLASEFWQSFCAARASTPSAKGKDIPMQYVCRTVEHFLSHLPDGTAPAPAVGVETIASAVSACGYEDTFNEA